MTSVLTPAQTELVTKMVRYGRSFALFCREVLGYADMVDEHEQLCDFLQHDHSPNKLILMPRYSFKSSIATVGYALWRLTLNDSLRILIYSDATSKAEGFLTSIKNHLVHADQTSRFREIYGPWDVDPKKGVWNQSAIMIRPRQHAHAEPSIDTGGIETSKVGMHYDLIIFDDVVSDKNVTSKDLMDKVQECYKNALSLLKPGGDVVMVGTRWHFGDLYGRILAENQQTKRFSTHIRKADVDGTYPFAKIGLTKDFLAQQKASQGSYTWSCLYQNEPANPEDALFRLEHFALYPPQHYPKDLFLTLCLDPATGQGDDNAAITVVGTDELLNMWVLEVVSGKLLPSEQVETILTLHQKYDVDIVGIEVNHYQKMLRRDLEFRIQQERLNTTTFRLFQIAEFTGTSANTKDMRIRALQPYHERGALKLPGHDLHTLPPALSRLVHQMIQYTDRHKPTHDDELDSLAQHVTIHRRGTPTKPDEPIPRLSPAWFEQEAYKEEVLAHHEMPRWVRNKTRMPEELTFS